MYFKYSVNIENYAERHYIKNFAKKYKKAWDFTLSAIIREYQSFDIILEKSIAEAITNKNSDVVIYKTEFKISGTKDSRHGSGNRCIVAKDNNLIRILLVYHKNDLGNGNETVNWKRIIKDNYKEFDNILK